MSKPIISIPKISDLKENLEEALKHNQLQILVNQDPMKNEVMKKWVKKHPMATVKINGVNQNANYMPIDKIEYMLDWIFQEWKIEVLDSSHMLNAVTVTVRLHYKNPINGDWYFHDGIGAAPIQKDAGSSFSIDTIKTAAIQMALPMAKSYAIKDAAEHIGRIFGRDLNRSEVLDYREFYGKSDSENNQEKEKERLVKLMKSCTSRESLAKFKKDCTTPELLSEYDDIYLTLK